MKYFEGKICSVFTVPINKNIKNDEEHVNYFVGLIESVTNEGILMKQLSSNLKNYFFKHSIVAICEEEVLDPQNEKDVELINEIKKIHEKEKEEYLNINQLNSIVKEVKNS